MLFDVVLLPECELLLEEWRVELCDDLVEPLDVVGLPFYTTPKLLFSFKFAVNDI